MVVGAGAGNFSVCLPRVRRLALVLPELATPRLREERLRLLTDELSVSGLLDVLVRSLLNGVHRLVVAWTRSLRLNLGVLAVRHLRLENLVLTRSIESLLTELVPVVDAGAWVVSPWLVVFGHVSLLPQLAVNLTHVELVLGMQRVVSVGIWVVRGRTHHIESSTRVCRRSHLSRRNTGRNIVGDDGVIVVLGRLILEKRLVEVLELSPVRVLMIMTRVGIFQVRRPLDQT